eukprot:537220_1
MVVGRDLIAVGLASIAAVMHAFAYILQKKAHNIVNEYNSQRRLSPLSKDDNSKNKSFVSDSKWIFGFALYIVGSIIAAAALIFGAQSVVAPLGSLTLVTNTILAANFLGEPFEKHHLIGIVIVIISSVFLVLFGPNEGDDYTLLEFKQAYLQLGFVIFSVVLTGLAIWIYWGVKYYELLNETAGNKNDVKHGRTFLMISYISLAAYFGSISVLLMKSAVLMLYNINAEIVSDWFFWFIVLGCVVVNFMLEYFRQRALACFGAMFVVPIYQVLYVIGAALFGAVYFGEFDQLNSLDLILFMSSLLMSLFGVLILAFDVASVYKTIKYNIQCQMLEYLEFFQDKYMNSESQIIFG